MAKNQVMRFKAEELESRKICLSCKKEAIFSGPVCGYCYHMGKTPNTFSVLVKVPAEPKRTFPDRKIKDDIWNGQKVEVLWETTPLEYRPNVTYCIKCGKYPRIGTGKIVRLKQKHAKSYRYICYWCYSGNKPPEPIEKPLWEIYSGFQPIRAVSSA